MSHGQPNETSGFETRAIHAGQPPDPATGSVITPVYLTSTYVQEQVGITKGYEYSRTGNPTRTALEECIASLEGGKHGLAFASGMAAITTLLLAALKPGDHVVLADDVYGGTYRLFNRTFKEYGVEFTLADMTHPDEVEAAVTPATRMLWAETPTNPLLKVLDIAALARIADAHNARLVVDNTFASPYLQRPLELGANVVLHSATKYLGGHSDVVLGLIVTSDELIRGKLAFNQNSIGAVPGPLDSYLVLRGIKTLAVRMREHSANAQRLAEYLETHPKVVRVYYPGLPSHPQYEVAKKQMSMPGGMLSFDIAGGEEAALKFVSCTRVFALAESLGGVESLIEHPGAMTHASLAGSPIEIGPALIRLSVGIESADDLLADLDQAFAQV
ncbi:MAG: cystathionine gamma-synthase [Chloroflexota bacterium]|nr:cystathionine gamma-synthase [Chloroflexota bacterium]